jgi:hypothetical protein
MSLSRSPNVRSNLEQLVETPLAQEVGEEVTRRRSGTASRRDRTPAAHKRGKL